MNTRNRPPPRVTPRPARPCLSKTTQHRQEQNTIRSTSQATNQHPSYGLETVGIEPTTPCLQSRRSPTELRPHKPTRNRQNLHPPPRAPPMFRALPDPSPDQLVGQGGLEPPTPRLSSVCSNQLSYWPDPDKTAAIDNRKDARPAPRCGEPHRHKAEPQNLTRTGRRA